jgi:hypothetical protein
VVYPCAASGEPCSTLSYASHPLSRKPADRPDTQLSNGFTRWMGSFERKEFSANCCSSPAPRFCCTRILPAKSCAFTASEAIPTRSISCGRRCVHVRASWSIYADFCILSLTLGDQPDVVPTLSCAYKAMIVQIWLDSVEPCQHFTTYLLPAERISPHIVLLISIYIVAWFRVDQ